MIKKSHVVQYLIDVKGYDREEAAQLYTDNGGVLEEMFSDSELTELADFNGIERVS